MSIVACASTDKGGGEATGGEGSGMSSVESSQSSAGVSESEGTAGAEVSTAETSSPESESSVGTTNEPVSTSGTGGVLEACLDMAMHACEICGCNACLDPLYACQLDVGCVALRNCAIETGCVGAECVRACADVIEMYGGAFSESSTLAVELGMCIEAGCPVCFE